MMYIERLYLYEVAKLIRKKDATTAEKWCKENELKIMKDTSGKFVCAPLFAIEYDRIVINELKEIHGDKWPEAYDILVSGNYVEYVDFDTTITKRDKAKLSEGATQLLKDLEI